MAGSVGTGHCVDQAATVGVELVEDDRLGDTEAAIGGVVVENDRVGAGRDRRPARDVGRVGGGAVRRQLRGPGGNVGVGRPDASGYQQVAGSEPVMAAAKGGGGVGRRHGDERRRAGERGQRGGQSQMAPAGSKADGCHVLPLSHV